MIGWNVLLSPVWEEFLAHVYNKHLHLLHEGAHCSVPNNLCAQVIHTQNPTRIRLHVVKAIWCNLVGLLVRRCAHWFRCIGWNVGWQWQRKVFTEFLFILLPLTTTVARNCWMEHVDLSNRRYHFATNQHTWGIDHRFDCFWIAPCEYRFFRLLLVHRNRCFIAGMLVFSLIFFPKMTQISNLRILTDNWTKKSFSR